MALGSAAEAWLAMVGIGAATLCAAMLAGRGTHSWQWAPLVILELFMFGATLVSWMIQTWFAAKIFIAIGVGASPALGLGIACGIALLLLAGAAGGLIVLAGYTVLGWRARFGSDLRNFLWLSRTGTWRPSDVSGSS
jgi:hypothetical protein